MSHRQQKGRKLGVWTLSGNVLFVVTRHLLHDHSTSFTSGRKTEKSATRLVTIISYSIFVSSTMKAIIISIFLYKMNEWKIHIRWLYCVKIFSFCYVIFFCHFCLLNHLEWANHIPVVATLSSGRSYDLTRTNNSAISHNCLCHVDSLTERHGAQASSQPPSSTKLQSVRAVNWQITSKIRL